jgi:hypothetical protein
MRDISGASEATLADIDYYYRYLASHLANAGDRKALDALLLDPSWLKARLAATRSPPALVADYEQYAHGQMQNFTGRTLRLTAAICARDERQLLPQLLGRLMGCRDPAAPSFLAKVHNQLSRPAIVTQRASLIPLSAEIARLAAKIGRRP